MALVDACGMMSSMRKDWSGGIRVQSVFLQFCVAKAAV